jgi:hypothetical protein
MIMSTNNSKELSYTLKVNKEYAYQTKGKITHRQAVTNRRFKRLLAKADRLESHKILVEAVEDFGEDLLVKVWEWVRDESFLDSYACHMLDRLEGFGFNSICNDSQSEEICPAYEAFDDEDEEDPDFYGKLGCINLSECPYR